MPTFNNGESAASVRTKINDAIEKVDGTQSISSVDINGGTIDGTVIGGSTPAAISGTTGSFSGKVTAQSDTYAIGVLPATATSGTVEQPKIAFEVRPLGATGPEPAAYIGVEEASVNSVQGSLTFATRRTNNNTVAPTEAMRITSTGSVGIGTGIPQGNLHVRSGSDTPAVFPIDHLSGGNSYGGYIQSIGPGENQGLILGSKVNSAFTEAMRINNLGNVGIGTSSPDAGLQVVSAGNRAATFTRTIVSAANNTYALRVDNSAQTSNMTASGAMAVDVNSGRAFTITGLGNVGIGTSSPTAKMHMVLSGTAVTADAGTAAIFQSNSTTGTGVNVALITGNVSVGSLDFGDAEDQDVGSVQYNHASNSMQFHTNAAERLRITSTGNVGIGTSSPSFPLDFGTAASGHVIRVGDDNADAYMSFSNPRGFTGYSVGQNAVALQGGFDKGVVFNVNNSTFGSGEAMRIDAAGNVGIGTSSPVVRLDVRGGSILTDSAYTFSGNSVTPSFTSFIHRPANNTIAFGTIGSERMRLTVDGRLLFNITTENPVTVSGGNLEGIQLFGGGGQFSRVDGPALITNRVSTNGETIQFRREGLVVGTISVTTTTTSYNTSSDYRLKEDVQPMVGASDRVLSLKPCNFAWKADGSRVDGFLAHEAQAVVPEAVTGDKDGEEMQAIDHSKLVPLLTAALQEALKEIADLKGRITALEA